MAKQVESIVSPDINIDPSGVAYVNLDDHEFFIWNKGLWVKYDVEDQNAFRIDKRDEVAGMDEEVVIPVNIKITWTLKG